MPTLPRPRTPLETPRSTGKSVKLKVASRLRCNNGEVAHEWALAGCGLIMKSWVDVARDVQAGRLSKSCPSGAASPRRSTNSSLKPATAPPRAPLPRRHGHAACLYRSAGASPRDFVIAGSSAGLGRPAFRGGTSHMPSIPLSHLFRLRDRFPSIGTSPQTSQMRKQRTFPTAPSGLSGTRNGRRFGLSQAPPVDAG